MDYAQRFVSEIDFSNYAEAVKQETAWCLSRIRETS